MNNILWWRGPPWIERGNEYWPKLNEQFLEPDEDCLKELKGEFPVIAEATRNHTFSKEISQVILADMVLATNFYYKNCLRVISAMRRNPS